MASATKQETDPNYMPLAKVSTPHVVRNAANITAILNESPASAADPMLRTRLLIAVMSCVGSVLLIAFFLIMFWRRRGLKAQRNDNKLRVHIERGVTIVEQPKPPRSGVRPMFLPLQLETSSARWGSRPESMTLPIHAPPQSLLRNQVQAETSPASCAPSTPKSAYIPIVPPRVTRYPVPPPGLSDHRSNCAGPSHSSKRGIGTIIIHPPRSFIQGDLRSPPPTYAQSTVFSSEEFQGLRKDSLPGYNYY